MKHIPHGILFPAAVQEIKNRAMIGLFDGTANFYNQFLISNCTWVWDDLDCVIIYTRDTGHHSSGWWKNPDYERCYHLSLSFNGGRNLKTTQKLADAFFGEYKNLIWTEPPSSQAGKEKEVWHYRLFCDENWQPIKPRGEVYTLHFTEKGWKSYSEVQHDMSQQKREVRNQKMGQS